MPAPSQAPAAPDFVDIMAVERRARALQARALRDGVIALFRRLRGLTAAPAGAGTAA